MSYIQRYFDDLIVWDFTPEAPASVTSVHAIPPPSHPDWKMLTLMNTGVSHESCLQDLFPLASPPRRPVFVFFGDLSLRWKDFKLFLRRYGDHSLSQFFRAPKIGTRSPKDSIPCMCTERRDCLDQPTIRLIVPQ